MIKEWEELWDSHTTSQFMTQSQFFAVLEKYGRMVREQDCAVVYGQCDNDNVAQRTVDAIRKLKEST